MRGCYIVIQSPRNPGSYTCRIGIPRFFAYDFSLCKLTMLMNQHVTTLRWFHPKMENPPCRCSPWIVPQIAGFQVRLPEGRAGNPHETLTLSVKSIILNHQFSQNLPSLVLPRVSRHSLHFLSTHLRSSTNERYPHMYRPHLGFKLCNPKAPWPYGRSSCFPFLFPRFSTAQTGFCCVTGSLHRVGQNPINPDGSLSHSW